MINHPQVVMPRLRGNDNLSRKDELCLGLSVFGNYSTTVIYDIYLGPREVLYFTRLAAVKRVPKVWESELLEHYKNRLEGINTSVKFPVKLGNMGYEILETDKMNIAFTTSYWPRDKLGHGKAKRLSYFLESITTHHLKTQGITHISTSFGPSHLRIAQLKRVGLPIREEVEVDTWLRAMGRGIKNRSNGLEPSDPRPYIDQPKHPLYQAIANL